MKKTTRVTLFLSVSLLIVFVLFTVLVSFVDAEQIGADGSSVGFATLNGYVHSLIGVNLTLYTITDLLTFIPIYFIIGFGILGLIQWIRRKSLLKVDFNILVLGGFYIVVLIIYLFFELLVINYRPILVEGVLEASYPSSTTVIVLCVMSTAAMQLNRRIKIKTVRISVCSLIIAFAVFMVLGRLISGVHWFTDVLGGAILSGGLVSLYSAISSIKEKT